MQVVQRLERCNKPQGRCFDQRSATGRNAEFKTNIAEMKVDPRLRAFEDQRNLPGGFALSPPREHFLFFGGEFDSAQSVFFGLGVRLEVC